MINDYLGRLIGHIGGGPDATLQWLATVTHSAEPTLSLPLERQLDNAMANLLDERLAPALNGFMMAVLQTENYARLVQAAGRDEPALLANAHFEALAGLGVGMVENRRRQFVAADAAFKHARARAAAAGHALLNRAAEYLWAANASDDGQPSAALLPAFEQLEMAAHDDLDAFAVDCLRARLYAKLLYRLGDRDRALEALENVIGAPLFEALGPIARGVMVRERGIVHAFCEDPAAAREDLRRAKAIFKSVGYEPGIVRATLSLARSHLFVDVQEAADDLNKVRAILHQQGGKQGGREMKSELAELESRLGDLAYVQGQFEAAEERYRRDRDLTTELGAPRRPMAYVEFNLGRALLARQEYAKAVERLRASAAGFSSVKDPFNELRSRQLLIEALLEWGHLDEVEVALGEVETLLEHLPDPADRPKQQAAIQVLRARVELQVKRHPLRARAYLHEALRLLHGHPKDAHFIRALLALADVNLATGDARGARQLWQRSARLGEAAGTQDLVVRAHRALRELPGGAGEEEHRSELEAACRREGLLEIEAAVLVARVRGLADAAAEFGPHALRNLARVLSEYSTAMTGCAELHDGHLVRFDGDSLLVLFDRDLGWPKEVLATQAALQMYQRFRDLRERWWRRWALPSDQERGLGMSVGIASGRAVAGHFGIATHHDFAVVGLAVSQAFALQRSGSDGQVTVTNEVSAPLHRWWPRLQLRPVEVEAAEGARVWPAYRVDAAQPHPRPNPLPPSEVPLSS